MARFEGEVRILPYALRRIRDRGLSQVDGEETLRDPEEIVSGGRGRFVAQKATVSPSRGLPALLRVIFEEQQTRRVIVNVYLTTKVDKYRRSQP